MSIDNFFMPIQPFFAFLRNHVINLYGFEFTLMDVITWGVLATVVLRFYYKITRD